MRILVVDDNVDAADTLAILLRLSGHQVLVAHDGAHALQQARTFRPEVAMLDIGLPHLDGYEVARALRALPATSGCILMALTGYGQEEDRRLALEAGFDHHLVKPVDFESIEALLACHGLRGKAADPGSALA